MFHLYSLPSPHFFTVGYLQQNLGYHVISLYLMFYLIFWYWFFPSNCYEFSNTNITFFSHKRLKPNINTIKLQNKREKDFALCKLLKSEIFHGAFPITTLTHAYYGFKAITQIYIYIWVTTGQHSTNWATPAGQKIYILNMTFFFNLNKSLNW